MTPIETSLLVLLGLAAGGLAAGVLAVVEWGAWTLVLPRRPLVGLADEPHPGEPIAATAPDGTRLAGTWRPHPDADGRTLILLHGLAEGRTSMQTRANGIHVRGWNVASLDSRAYGDSGGPLGSFGGREAGDLIAWVDALSARVGPSIRPAVWGRSMGAAVALRSSVDDVRITAIVLEAPYIDLRITAATLLRRYRIPASTLMSPLVLRRAARLAGVRLDRPRPIDLAPRVTVPTLILRGTSDLLVSDAETSALATALGGPVERVEVPGARHSQVVDVGGPDLIARVGDWLDRVSQER